MEERLWLARAGLSEEVAFDQSPERYAEVRCVCGLWGETVQPEGTARMKALAAQRVMVRSTCSKKASVAGAQWARWEPVQVDSEGPRGARSPATVVILISFYV